MTVVRLDVLGTSRTASVHPTEYPRVGRLQYPDTLPLDDHEIVLTFDDGPLPPRTTHILDVLACHCVKATFFFIGRMASRNYAVVQRACAEGHSIGTHTETHPLNLRQLSVDEAEKDVANGIASVSTALGNDCKVAPFFRFPGLLRSSEIEDYLFSRGIMIWSADIVADDWKGISAQQITACVFERLSKLKKGILLLHDIQPETVIALPELLRILKQQGYRIVHVVASGCHS